MPAFSPENSWSAPRLLCIRRGEGGFGLSIKGSRPAKISTVDQSSPAEVSTLAQIITFLLSRNNNIIYTVLYKLEVEYRDSERRRDDVCMCGRRMHG